LAAYIADKVDAAQMPQEAQASTAKWGWTSILLFLLSQQDVAEFLTWSLFY
jgi:hypothetical protein